MPVNPSLFDLCHLTALLSQDSKKMLAAESVRLEFPRRSVVLKKEQLPEHFFIIEEGRIQGTDFTIDGREVGLFLLGAGDYFGDMSMIDGKPVDEYFVCTTRTSVIQTPKVLMEEALFSHPIAAKTVTLNITQKLRAITEQRKILALSTPMQKVCTQILSMVHRHQAAAHLLARQATANASVAQPGQTAGVTSTAPAASDQDQVPFAPTHQELAIMINASRETVTRIFQVLQAENIILKQGDRLIILKPDKLRSLATEGK